MPGDDEQGPPAFDRRRLADRVFDDLKQRLVVGAIERGSKLPTEKELAKYYSVGISSVREAVRGLSAVGLVQVRHGHGVYASAGDDSLVAILMGALIQSKHASVAETLALSGLFREHAAVGAVANASDEDVRKLRNATIACAQADTLAESAAAARAFNNVLTTSAGNALLGSIGAYLIDLHAEFVQAVTRKSPSRWVSAFKGVQDTRDRLVSAIEARDATDAAARAREYHDKVVRAVLPEPGAKQELTEPELRILLASVVTDMNKGLSQRD